MKQTAKLQKVSPKAAPRQTSLLKSPQPKLQQPNLNAMTGQPFELNDDDDEAPKLVPIV